MFILRTKKTDSNYRTSIHYQFSDSLNVLCFNGSYHLNRTKNKKDVTCIKCLKELIIKNR